MPVFINHSLGKCRGSFFDFTYFWYTQGMKSGMRYRLFAAALALTSTSATANELGGLASVTPEAIQTCADQRNKGIQDKDEWTRAAGLACTNAVVFQENGYQCFFQPQGQENINGGNRIVVGSEGKAFVSRNPGDVLKFQTDKNDNVQVEEAYEKKFNALGTTTKASLMQLINTARKTCHMLGF